MTPAEVERAVERTGVRSVADLRTMLAELREVYEGRDAAQRETIASLRRRAEAAEAEADALRLRLAETTVPPVVIVGGAGDAEPWHARETTLDAHRPVQRLWQRLRAALGDR